MKAPAIFRHARPEEAGLLTEIALAAKRHWGYPEEWMAEWHAELTITAEFIRTQHVGVAEQTGVVVGFYALRRESDQWHLEHLWLRPAHFGQGHGRRLYAEAVREARADGATALHIKADPNAEPFYLKIGAVRTGVEIYQLLGRHRRELPLLRHQL